MKKSIYLFLKGRIGNQLFIYAFARAVQHSLGDETELIIDDTEVIKLNWENSLTNYSLPNVRYVHDRTELKSLKWFWKFCILKIAERFTGFKSNYVIKAKREKLLKPILNLFGILLCENGYTEFDFSKRKSYMLSGYFQAEKYFKTVKDELIKTFSFANNLEYPDLDVLEAGNSVCISIKVEHNVGSSLYAVCGKEYWQDAVSYIIENVPEPVFFICSDNIDYVKNNLIDCNKYRVVFQDSSQPVHKSLAAMSRCKHFIIGNTTFGWWAQYMSANKEKIMIAPNQWMLVDMPIDIYQDGWHLIDVKKYLGEKAL